MYILNWAMNWTFSESLRGPKTGRSIGFNWATIRALAGLTFGHELGQDLGTVLGLNRPLKANGPIFCYQLGLTLGRTWALSGPLLRLISTINRALAWANI